MDEPGRNELVERLFHDALERDADSRADFLTAACGGDAALLAEVESLLASHDRNQHFMEKPAFDLSASDLAAQALEAERAEAPAGRRVGDYKLAREVGRGGMGAVYEAEREGRRVAVKLVKRGMDTDFILRRFERERRILAALDHPYIAHLVDGGATEEGQPFFVMEYVEGLPLDEYARARRLSTAERLELFRKVCEAVSYAHGHRVIHRDIKPSNILVTEEGVPKLLDFGVAKLLDPDAVGQSGDLTATAHRVMTPEYASPEQLRGLPLTEASDVYSLGVLLYVLLTGRHPYRFRSRVPEEILKSVAEEGPHRPSEAVQDMAVDVGETPGGAGAVSSSARRPGRDGTDELSRRLRGDLDKIVLKALRTEPQRRYASVGQLSEDIRRYLAGLPVEARGDSLVYRGVKFLSRHRSYALSAVALASLSLLIGVRFLSPYGKRTGTGDPVTVAPPAGGGGAVGAYIADEEAQRLYLMGRYFWNQRTAESFQKGIEYFRSATERDPGFALAYAGLADCYGLLGAYMVWSPHDAFPPAREAALKAIKLDESSAEAHTSLALIIWLYDWDWERADAEFRRAIEINPRYVTAHHWRGLFLGEMGRFDEAVAEMQQALELEPVSLPVHADYGRVLFWARRYDESLEKYRKASEMGPHFGAYYVEVAQLYEQMGMAEEWRSLYERNGWFSPRERKAFAEGGFTGFRRAQLEYDLPGKRVGLDRAELCAQLGKKDQAFEALQEALNRHDHRMSQLKVNPRLDSLRSDPRFADLLRRMNLTP